MGEKSTNHSSLMSKTEKSKIVICYLEFYRKIQKVPAKRLKLALGKEKWKNFSELRLIVITA